MKRINERGLRDNAGAALACLALLVLPGCGDNTSLVSSGGPGAGAANDGKSDAGNKGATSGKADAGSTGSKTPGAGTTTATNGNPANGAPQPKTLMQLDECGAGNAAGLSQSDVDKLKAGGAASGVSLLYPYDKTVFPRGLSAPLLMWQGGSANAAYVRIRSQYFEYDGCLKPAANGQVQLPQPVWEAAGVQTMGPTTPYDLQLTLLDGGTVRGPLKAQLLIAQATLKGSIFYNSYNSPLAGATGGGGLFGGGGGGGNGAVLRIKPGGSAEFFARSGTCTGCHAVSANGERMIAKELQGGRGGRGGAGTDGQVYNLTPTTAANPAPTRGTATAAFVGLSPDGKVFINTAVKNGIGPETQGGQGTGPDTASALWETDTGNAVPGSGIPATALMPTFSSDAKLIAFNDYAAGSGKGLSLMDYDTSARKASNERSLYTSTTGYTGWPFVLPDNGAVIFTIGEMSNFSGDGVGINDTTKRGPKSDLTIVDAETGKATILARAMGFLSAEDAAAEKTYLPFGAEELHQSYYPTVSPVAAGGYFWVFFDSMRHYGNQGLHRQLWVTAVAIQHSSGEFNSGDGPYATDPSAPAFYLPGQELTTANHRAFTALDPCRANGASCESGIDCCSGFCTDGVCGPPSGCSKTNEACTSDGDCCSSTDRCIAGYCGTIFI